MSEAVKTVSGIMVRICIETELSIASDGVLG